MGVFRELGPDVVVCPFAVVVGGFEGKGVVDGVAEFGGGFFHGVHRRVLVPTRRSVGFVMTFCEEK